MKKPLEFKKPLQSKDKLLLKQNIINKKIDYYYKELEKINHELAKIETQKILYNI
jgi:hypothetical protein